MFSRQSGGRCYEKRAAEDLSMPSPASETSTVLQRTCQVSIEDERSGRSVVGSLIVVGGSLVVGG